MAISRPRYNKKKQRYKKKNGESKFKQSFYIPKNPEKYVQPIDETMNSEKYPFMRSSWERKFAEYCDNNPDVIRWSTEYTNIKYWDTQQNKFRRYFPDFFVEFKDGRKIVVEIKPLKNCKNINNQDKWLAAREFCKYHGYDFVIMTEKELGIK